MRREEGTDWHPGQGEAANADESHGPKRTTGAGSDTCNLTRGPWAKWEQRRAVCEMKKNEASGENIEPDAIGAPARSSSLGEAQRVSRH